MTQLESARHGMLTTQMKKVLEQEPLTGEELLSGLKEGTIVLPWNNLRDLSTPKAIGAGCYTKINANIGTSPACNDIDLEREKLRVSLKYGADTLMDLSSGGNIKEIRSLLLEHSPVPFGTVPIYEVAVRRLREEKDIHDMTEKDILEVIEDNARDGVDFITVHCGVTLAIAERLETGVYKRLMPSVSRGGALLLRWMREHKRENPFYEYYDEILAICKEYDVTLSLGDGLRPGCLKDATDQAQIEELNTLGELHQRALERDVQSMVEGPGHVPLSEVKMNVRLQKKLCGGAPFYVLGPIVTDIAPGYDHITAAIGGALAGAAGADFLCYVTPAEHLCLPSLEDVKEGVIASKIAAHVADLEKGIGDSRKWDEEMAVARKKLDWEGMFQLALDSDKARKYRALDTNTMKECTMCEALCSVKQTNNED